MISQETFPRTGRPGRHRRQTDALKGKFISKTHVQKEDCNICTLWISKEDKDYLCFLRGHLPQRWLSHWSINSTAGNLSPSPRKRHLLKLGLFYRHEGRALSCMLKQMLKFLCLNSALKSLKSALKCILKDWHASNLERLDWSWGINPVQFSAPKGYIPSRMSWFSLDQKSAVAVLSVPV